jgi:curli biogenesis system outer membrane secretion channel CsgG
MKNCIALGFAAVLLAGCGTTTSETYSRDPMTEIGNYPPPPAGLVKARAAVMEFQDKTEHEGRQQKPVGKQACEQFETLVMRSNRFGLVERGQLNTLLKEQKLDGIVDPSELAKPGRIRGVDYVFIGTITNFRVKINKTKTGGGIFDAFLKPIAPLDIDTSKTVVETQVGVDIKLVNTNTGEIVAKDFGEVKREDMASAWGLRILGIGGDAKNELVIDTESQGKILRWALDESYKKMLPPIDEKFSRAQPSYCQTCKVELPPGQKFCTKCGQSVAKPKCKCGAELEVGAKFCGGCGAKIEAAPAPK